MTVAEAKPGDIVQIILLGPNDRSGNYYKISTRQESGLELIIARKQFTGEKTGLWPHNKCRVITDQIEGF